MTSIRQMLAYEALEAHCRHMIRDYESDVEGPALPEGKRQEVLRARIVDAKAKLDAIDAAREAPQ